MTLWTLFLVMTLSDGCFTLISAFLSWRTGFWFSCARLSTPCQSRPCRLCRDSWTAPFPLWSLRLTIASLPCKISSIDRMRAEFTWCPSFGDYHRVQSESLLESQLDNYRWACDRGRKCLKDQLLNSSLWYRWGNSFCWRLIFPHL